MTSPRRKSIHVATALAAGLALHSCAAQAEWLRDEKSIAWQRDGSSLWRFSFDTQKGKPFFDPLSAGGHRLTTFKPEDHPWHYGLWFSWKYINGANYWEEDRQSGRAEGATRWSTPQIDARADGSASIRMELTYTHPSGRVDMQELRELQISAPHGDGGYEIDWRSTFTAGAAGAVLDRTPMPGEANGQVNGGYAGLGVRLAAAPTQMSIVTAEGPVTQFASDRARPASSALAANFTEDGKAVGSIAIFSDADNTHGRAPWYVVNAAEGMRFICAAILAPEVRKLQPGEVWRLRYRIAVQAQPFSSQALARPTAGK